MIAITRGSTRQKNAPFAPRQKLGRLKKNNVRIKVIKMARTWTGHIGETVVIGAGIAFAGLALDAAAGQGSVPYLNNVVHTIRDYAPLAGAGAAAIYFAAGIPRIRSEYRQRELEHIAMETSRLRALRNRERARNQYHHDIGGGDHHE